MRLLILATALATGIAGIADSAQSQFLGASNRSSANSAACRSAYGVPNDACAMPTGTLGAHDFTTVDIDTSGFLACYLFRDDSPSSDVGDDSCLESGIADDLAQGSTAVEISTDVPFGFSADARSVVFTNTGTEALYLLDDAANGHKFDAKTYNGLSMGCWSKVDTTDPDFMFGKLGRNSTQTWSPIGVDHVVRFIYGVTSVYHNRKEATGVWFNWRADLVNPLFVFMRVTEDEDTFTGTILTHSAAADKNFGVGHVPGNFFPLDGQMTECWFADHKLTDVEYCRLCRCGLKGDFTVDRRSYCETDSVGRNKCAMSTNKCYSS